MDCTLQCTMIRSISDQILFQKYSKESTQSCKYLFHPRQKNKLLVGHGQKSSAPEVQAPPACHLHLTPTMQWFFYLILMMRALMTLKHQTICQHLSILHLMLFLQPWKYGRRQQNLSQTEKHHHHRHHHYRRNQLCNKRFSLTIQCDEF